MATTFTAAEIAGMVDLDLRRFAFHGSACDCCDREEDPLARQLRSAALYVLDSLLDEHGIVGASTEAEKNELYVILGDMAWDAVRLAIANGAAQALGGRLVVGEAAAA